MSAQQDIWVAFSDGCDVWWLRGLKRGFRHCFAIIKQHDQWVVIDPLLHKTDIAILNAMDAGDVPRALRAQGMIVVQVTPNARPIKRRFSLTPCSCVEAVKRLIDLQAFWVLSPYQLYRRLQADMRF